MQIPQHQRLSDEERANLVAFLDGEVDEDLSAQLEAKVSKSPSVRKEVDALEKTWSMLDWLPRPELPDDFATQAVTRIHSQQLRAELIEGRLQRHSIFAAKCIGWVAGVAAAAFIGFTAVRLAWRDPSRELAEHLDILDNMESYRVIPDVKFLEDMVRLGYFVDPPAEQPAEGAAGESAAPAEAAPGAPAAANDAPPNNKGEAATKK
jgi:hypothetical protein